MCLSDILVIGMNLLALLLKLNILRSCDVREMVLIHHV